ncbi:hypothetical protein [Actinomadura rubrisoli]|uniref:Uncharacterized protein n=1 Tax=Actinomadura rubrisoli TaxID=2530368 RepID=A0A4R5CFL1_9ACTN|nr:hypothetical protein [Actinomadura rubrisoli]TDD97190.1 hypothetical protein E1298_01775 [Actinomadura rubrisoli]
MSVHWHYFSARANLSNLEFLAKFSKDGYASPDAAANELVKLYQRAYPQRAVRFAEIEQEILASDTYTMKGVEGQYFGMYRLVQCEQGECLNTERRIEAKVQEEAAIIVTIAYEAAMEAKRNDLN